VQSLDPLRRNPNVAYIESDQSVQVTDIESNPPWGLDRIDQPALPLSGTYSYTATCVIIKTRDTIVQLG